MDLELREVWLKEKDVFPTVYRGKVCRVKEEDSQYRIAVVFEGFEKEFDERIEALTEGREQI